MNYHQTVLKDEIRNFLVSDDRGIYLDVTCGGGGHAEALLEQYPYIRLVASDWDSNAIKATQERLARFQDRVIIMQSSFALLRKTLKENGLSSFHGILADFGTSRYQLAHQDGFSFHHDSFLDMRMSSAYRKIVAADILAHYSEKELADIFFYFGQERHAKKIARMIVERRRIKPIRTTMHLASIIEEILPKTGYIHPATKIFQALRIEVNKEFEEIESFLAIVPEYLVVGGRLACISFHSLEDGLVKKFYMAHKQSFSCFNNNKIILPTDDEVRENKAARSAKLRILEKIS